MRVLIAGGGTGGHLYPGIAVARELLARVTDAQVTFVGTTAGIESRVIPREGFALDVIRSGGLKGKSLDAIAMPAHQAVLDAMLELEIDPRPPGCIKLTDRDAWRIRVRSYRVVYEVDDSQKIVIVTGVGHRRDVYRK